MQTIMDHKPEARHRNGEHILINLTYIGKNNIEASGIALTRALEHWRRYFEEVGITSALVINDTYFMHSIEGPRPVINQSLVKLISEYLQIFPQIVEVEEIEVRQWEGYMMKYLSSSPQDEEYILKSFSSVADFNPYLMKQDQITSFIKSMFEENGSHINSVG